MHKIPPITTTTATTLPETGPKLREEHGPKTGIEEGAKPRIILVCSLIICTTIFISATTIAVVVRRRKRQVAESKKEDNWEIDRKNLTLGPKLGEGNFGTVYKGSLKNSNKVRYFLVSLAQGRGEQK